MTVLGQNDAQDHSRNTSVAASAGDVLVLYHAASAHNSGGGFSNTIQSIDSVGGGTWTQDVVDPGSDPSDVVEIWSCYLTSGIGSGTTITLRGPTGHISPTWGVFKVNGLGAVPDQADRLAGADSNTQGFSSSVSSPSIVPDADGCVLFGLHDGTDTSAGAFWTPGGSWIELVDYSGTGAGFTESGTKVAVQYQIQATAASIASNGTSADSCSWTSAIVAYKEAAGIVKTGAGVWG